MPAVTVVPRSANAKLGGLAATYVSQATCPSSCPLYRNGCYAESGPAGWTTRRLNRSREKNVVAIAKEEARLIDRLPSGTTGLRLHVVGDAATPAAARIVSSAMLRYERRNPGKKAFTYTHGHEAVPVESWQGARVLASCESGEQVKRAWKRGYAAAIIVPAHPTNKLYKYQGVTVLPCPNQFEGSKVTCARCNICKSPRMLRRRRWVVGFASHGSGASKVKRVLLEV
jgi:hypothetical protein